MRIERIQGFSSISPIQITDFGCKAYRCTRDSFGVYTSVFYKSNVERLLKIVMRCDTLFENF